MADIDHGGVILDAGIEIIEAPGEASFPLFQEVQRHICRDGINPSVKGRFAPEALQRAISLGEDILKEIVCILFLRGHVIDHSIKLGGIFADELIESTSVPILRTADEVMIWVTNRFLGHVRANWESRRLRARGERHEQLSFAHDFRDTQQRITFNFLVQ